MSVPEILTKSIADAKEKLINNPEGELILPVRKKLWAAMGELESEVGRKRRSKLARLCVELAFPVWDCVQPPAKHPKLVLKMIDEYFEGQINDENVLEEFNAYYGKMDCIACTLKYQLAKSVGIAAIQSVWVAARDECFGAEDEFPDVLDEDMEPDQWDVSYYISGALAGFKWIEGASVEKLGEFFMVFR